MKTKNWFLVIFEAIVWYGFVYYLLYSIKNSVNLYISSLVLLTLIYVGTISCPWFRNTKAFKKIIEE